MNRKISSLNWLKKEISKDNLEIEREKNKTINEIKRSNLKEMIRPKEVKTNLTLWERIIKVLFG
jgi:hypothetical protein